SDGLTDLVSSSSLHDIVRRFAGQPDQVVKELIDAANAAGGKDNISVVYVEGEQFAPIDGREMREASEITRRGGHPPAVEDHRKEMSVGGQPTNRSRATGLGAIAVVAGFVAATFGPWPLGAVFQRPTNAAAGVPAVTIAVGP